MEETVKERLIAYLMHKRLTRQMFCESIGVSNSYVDNIRKSIQPEKVTNIAKKYPDLNLEWLLAGVGEMLKNDALIEPAVEELPKNEPQIKNEALQKDGNSEEVIMIPILNLDARGGLVSNDQCDVPEYTTGLMPFSRSIAKKGDVVIPVFGDSMAPKYSSGSFVLIRNIAEWDKFLELGTTYVIELTDGRRMIKNIMEGDDCNTFRLVSINHHYEPTLIPKEMIRHVFIVAMAVRRDMM